MDISGLKRELAKDKQFFQNYKSKFEAKLNEELEKFVDQSLEGLKANIKDLALEIYDRLLLKEEPIENLKQLLEQIFYYDLGLKAIFVNPFLELTKDYAEYLFKSGGNFVKLKALFGILAYFYDLLEEIYKEKLEEYRKKLEAKHLKDIEILKATTQRKEKQVIYTILSKLKNKQIELKKFYRGIPIICKAKIMELEPSIDFLYLYTKGCNYKIFYQINNIVFLKHPELPKAVAGKVTQGNPKEGTIVLTGLHFVDLPEEKRTCIRLEPEEPVEVFLLNNGKKYRGLMKDISVQGIGVIFDELPPLNVGDRVYIKTHLENLPLETPATVKYINPNYNRIGFFFTLEGNLEKKLSQLLMEKQFEILKGLRF